jgi:hypothetical protein
MRNQCWKIVVQCLDHTELVRLKDFLLYLGCFERLRSASIIPVKALNNGKRSTQSNPEMKSKVQKIEYIYTLEQIVNNFSTKFTRKMKTRYVLKDICTCCKTVKRLCDELKQPGNIQFSWRKVFPIGEQLWSHCTHHFQHLKHENIRERSGLESCSFTEVFNTLENPHPEQANRELKTHNTGFQLTIFHCYVGQRLDLKRDIKVLLIFRSL